jgi:hypothetical protein
VKPADENTGGEAASRGRGGSRASFPAVELRDEIDRMATPADEKTGRRSREPRTRARARDENDLAITGRYGSFDRLAAAVPPDVRRGYAPPY